MTRLVLLILLSALSAACSPERAHQKPDQNRPESEDVPTGPVEAQVTRIIDGDTIDVDLSGEVKRVRYIGIDTPERDVCYFREATQRNTALVGRKQVRLVKDVSETDRFQRLLRYVYVGDLFVNAELVEQGYAAASTHPPDVRHADLFVRLAREARENKKGLWDAAVCPESASPSPTESASALVGPVGIGDIHYDAAGNDHQNLNDEWVQIRNSGSDPVSLAGWTLSDSAIETHTYTFPSAFRLSGGRSVIVRSGSGADTETDIYWGSGSAIWNNDGDTVTLRNQAGAIVDQRTY